MDEKTLIQQAKQGNTEALGALYEAHVDSVYRFMFYRTGDAMVAEDLSAEVFADMITAIQRYKERGLPFRAWLFRIARSRLADYWRGVERQEKYQDRVLSHDYLTAPFSTGNAAADVETLFRYESLRKALGYLTEAEMEVVVLRFAGGLDHREIARVIRSNANAVKSRMHRALHKLRDVLEQLQEFHE